jgi:glutathione S-transferase
VFAAARDYLPGRLHLRHDAVDAAPRNPHTPAMSERPKLYIGNKNYSSWSMRPWLALTWAGLDFEEVLIPLGGPGYGKSKIAEILAVSPSGKVPALEWQGHTLWDSLAICEWAAEQRPAVQLWPTEPMVRALARAAACEMHSGFAALRRDLSMNIRRRADIRTPWAEDVREDIARVQELWAGLRARFADAGPYLFGRRSIADAMFAPVATRFRTYGVALEPVCAAYCATIFADAAFQAWERAAQAETWTIPVTDNLYAE